MESDAPKLVERWPTLARQLRDALSRDSEPGLASQVHRLRVFEMCTCGNDFCQSFFTEQPPDGVYPSDRHRNWYPGDDDPGWEGYLVLDVVGVDPIRQLPCDRIGNVGSVARRMIVSASAFVRIAMVASPSKDLGPTSRPAVGSCQLSSRAFQM